MSIDSKYVRAFAVCSALLAAPNWLTFTVYPGNRCVIFNRFFGVEKYVRPEGLSFYIPFLQQRILFDVRTRPKAIPTITGTKDLQNVSLTIRILFRPDITRLVDIYKTLGSDYDERILPSITTEVMKSVVAKYDAAELITQRDQVSLQIREELSQRAKFYGIILDDISIINLAFGKEFMTAVELKQVAQQEAERAKFLVEKAEYERNAAILSSEGDALAAELLAQAFSKSGDSLIELRKLEAAEEIARNLSSNSRITYIPNNNNMLISLPNTNI